MDARAAIGDLLAVDPQGVVFGRSATELTFQLARTLAKEWGPGDEVVVSRLDHDANIRPWTIAAEAVGARVRWVDFDAATGELAPEVSGGRVTERTRLVAVTAASNLIGTRPDLPAIAARGARLTARSSGSTVCTRRRTCSPTCPRAAPTSGSARPTSSSARTTASSLPTRRSSRASAPTSCCRRRRRARTLRARHAALRTPRRHHL